MIAIGYLVVALIVARLAIGHYAYSYTLRADQALMTWNERSWFPHERQSGEKPPAWPAGVWRGGLLALVWPLIPVWRLLARFPMYVGNERRARMIARRRAHEERCEDVNLLP